MLRMCKCRTATPALLLVTLLVVYCLHRYVSEQETKRQSMSKPIAASRRTVPDTKTNPPQPTVKTTTTTTTTTTTKTPTTRRPIDLALYKRIRHLVDDSLGGQRRIKHKAPHPNDDYSSHGQSKYVDRRLRGRVGGYFVEVGAGDGEIGSASLFFELQRNWTGLLIDDNPRTYPTLMSRRRHAKMLCACLNPQIGRSTVRHLRPPKSDKMASELHIASTNVTCYSLNDIFGALNITHVDYLALGDFDTKETQLAVLGGIDWETMPNVDIISVECAVKTSSGWLDETLTGNKVDEVRQVMKATGVYEELGLMKAFTLIFGRMKKVSINRDSEFISV